MIKSALAEKDPWHSYDEGELAVQARVGVGRNGLSADALYHGSAIVKSLLRDALPHSAESKSLHY